VLPPRSTRRALLAASFLAASSLPACALEHVTLRNGFSYDCARQQPLDAGHVRLFTSADGNNFIDIPAADIASIETLPDPPPPQPTPTPAAAPVADIPTLLQSAGSRHNIDAELLASVVHAESGFNPHAVSRAGAHGLMQLMPTTAAQLGVTDAFQPDENIAGGSAYLDALLTRYHDDLKLALAAYNAGPAAVDRYHGIPPFRETRAYVARVMTEFKRRKLALQAAAKQAAQHAAPATAIAMAAAPVAH
jgi:soluble lytic murein transglycosylase-like protein